jgi:hypothetical protein
MGEFTADRTNDEDPRTFWVAADTRPGQSLTMDLGAPKTVRAVQVNFADYKSGRFDDAPDIYTELELQHSLDGSSWSHLARTEPPRRDRPNAYFELPAPVRARFIRYLHGHVGAANLAISDLRVFGTAPGVRRPATPSGVAARRDSADARNATVTWRPVPGAVGYNVRWGIAPAKLRQTYQVWADAAPSLEVRALTLGQAYDFAIEAFDENGVSPLSAAVHVP